MEEGREEGNEKWAEERRKGRRGKIGKGRSRKREVTRPANSIKCSDAPELSSGQAREIRNGCWNLSSGARVALDVVWMG